MFARRAIARELRKCGETAPTLLRCAIRNGRQVIYGKLLNMSMARFSTFSAIDRLKLEQLRQSIRSAGGADEKKLGEYMRLLVAVSPKEAIQEIEKGWENGKLPVSDFFVKEYMKAAATLGKLDSVNLTGIMALLQSKGQGDASGRLNFDSSMRFPSAGGSPNDPLYVTNPDPGWKSQMWKLARSAVVIFLVLSFTSAVLDDFKGAAGGIGARMGMGNVIHQAEHSDKTFDDVVGIDEAKGELEEIVQYLKNPKKFTRLGGKLPKGVLLTGPPGTGKTLLARAIAGEAGVPFFYSSGSEFEEMYVGVGARRVRELFEAAKGKSPCIIFIDEIDAIGGSRKEKEQSAMKMTLNQLLVEMDGFEQNTGVIVIAATNFPNSLDAALVRPGRFDKQVDVPMPDIGGRKAIIDLYIKKIPTTSDVDTEQIARGTPGFSGAELYNLVNQAAVKASVAGDKAVSMGAFEFAKDKIMMGVERKSAIISPETMKMTAFHEAGHALVALKTDGADPIHKATIMPRGRALGMVMQLPDGDQTSYSRKQMLARLDVCMGGRVAEELVYGAENVTSGASSDIQQATRLAKVCMYATYPLHTSALTPPYLRPNPFLSPYPNPIPQAMVTKYGLSDKVGLMFLDDKEKTGGDIQRDVDSEVRALLSESYARAKRILTLHRKELDSIANGLVMYESLSGSEVVDLAMGVHPNMKLRSQKPSREVQSIPLRKDGGVAGGKGPSKPAPPVPQKPVSAPASPPADKKTVVSSREVSAASPRTDAAPTAAVAAAAMPIAAGTESTTASPTISHGQSSTATTTAHTAPGTPVPTPQPGIISKLLGLSRSTPSTPTPSTSTPSAPSPSTEKTATVNSPPTSTPITNSGVSPSKPVSTSTPSNTGTPHTGASSNTGSSATSSTPPRGPPKQ